MLIKRQLWNKRIEIFSCLLAVIVVSIPLLGSTIFQGHDTFFHTQRIVSISNALREGQFPVRIYKEIFDGYGYGSSLFYPELFLYIPALMHLAGASIVTSYHIFVLMINIATILVAKYSFSVILKSRQIGFLAAIIYELSVYRMVDLYTRGSLGENLALIFCPLALCGIVYLLRGTTEKWWLLMVGFSGLLQSHVLTFVMMVIMTAVIMVINIRKILNKKTIVSLTKAVFMTIGINLWFLIPFLQVSSMKVQAYKGDEKFWNTNSMLAEIFDVTLRTSYGVETYSSGLGNTITKTVGIVILLGCVFFIYCLLLGAKGQKRRLLKDNIIYLVLGGIAICMLTNLFPWNLIKQSDCLRNFFEKFQFMWRFNIIAVLLLSMVASVGIYIMFCLKNKKKVLFCLTLGISIYSLIYINNFVRASSEFDDQGVMEISYMDTLYLLENNDIFVREELESNAKQIQYDSYKRGNAEISLNYSILSNENEVYIDVPITYYPGYVAKINGEDCKVECGDGGVVRINIPSGKKIGKLEVEYVESNLYKAADVVSMLCLFALVIRVIISLKAKHKDKTNSHMKKR